MSFLLDTNVVSEWVKPRPDPGVVAWLDAVEEDSVQISVVTLAELRFGIERLPPGRRRARLAGWLEAELPLRFDGRIVAVDAAIADAWGRIVARGLATGTPIGPIDAFLAATAEQRGLTLVTRNVKNFAAVVTHLLSPWEGG